ncbi:zinc transporter ZIP1 [Anabrus simplex]|uniref:zinc transporter ZIP1 n=1 Tax=Anabrus simplex TaxID=316456 RepID=UPI0034DCE420
MMNGVVRTKVLSLAGLALGSFLLGILPACLSPSHFRRWPLAMSAMLCTGGGVLLATALLHILPEAREDLPYLAEPFFCAGFFLLYLLDELVHCFWTSSSESRPCSRSVDESTSLLQPGPSHRGSGDDPSLLCHTTFSEPCPRAPSSRTGLLLALTLHSLLEGMAVGLQPTSAAVLLLVGAVASHKLVVSFCLGAELVASGSSSQRLMSEMLLYAFGSSFGIGVGMLLLKSRSSLTSSTVPTLQAIAGGTLLYVTVCEVLPRERAKWHHQSTHRFAGLVQFFSVVTGFVMILGINCFFEVSEGQSSVEAT